MKTRTCWHLVAAASILAAAGCGNNGLVNASGRLTHQGKPVVCGVVIVRGPDNIEMTGTIQPDGGYTVQGVTSGVVKIAVVSPNPAETAKMLEAAGRKAGSKGGKGPGAAVGSAPDPSKWFALPAKYESPDTSELTTTLKSGTTLYDVVLP